MKLLQNKKSIISIIVIAILLVAIGGVIYSIYNNKQETIAQPINENSQEIEENKNIAYINKIEETTRKYN